MDGNTNNMGGMGITSIWDIIVFLIISRMFGLNGGTGTAETAAAVTTAGVETAVRNAQDVQNTQNSIAAISAKLAECCCDTKLMGKDIEIGQKDLANMFQSQISALQNDTNQHFCDLEIRSLTQRLTAAETALNNCNQTAAVSAIVSNAVNPIASAVSSILAQLNCGVKAVPYTPSLPVVMPYTPYAPPVAFGGCNPCNPCVG